MKYKRILLKLSGESLAGPQHTSIDAGQLNVFANEIKKIHEEGVEVAVVIGGGNIFRGLAGSSKGINRIQGDYMGMLATVINCLALQTALEEAGIPSCVLSGIAIDPVAEKTSSRKAIIALENGQVVLIAGGTGNPFFTTDSAAVLRALEIHAELLLKGTRVDGVYTSDPEKDPSAVKYSRISYDEALQKQLKIMDLTAFALCKENHLPVIVFNMNIPGNLFRIVAGEKIGTLVDD